MSKEFEEIVLKKLKKLDIIETEVKNNTQRLGKLEIEVKETKKNLQSIDSRLDNLEIEIKESEEVVKYLNQNFTKFDYEINKKIDTLFDAYKTNEDKISVHETEIASLNAKVFNQDIRISNLEDKVLAAV